MPVDDGKSRSGVYCREVISINKENKTVELVGGEHHTMFMLATDRYQ